jgi:Ca-activated chloride channel family protein
LDEANQRLTDMGLSYGELLVFTAETPTALAVDAAQNLAAHGYHVSVIPMLQNPNVLSLFTKLAKAGQGEMIAFTDTPEDIQRWLKLGHATGQYQMNKNDDVPLWRDEGRWFLLPALVLLLPLFRRGWLARVCT